LNKLISSISLQHLLKKHQNHLTEPELITFILENVEFFIAVDSRFLLRETKLDFTRGKQKFLMVDIQEIKYLKTHSQNMHFLLNEKTDHVLISLPMLDFVHSGLYTDRAHAAKDIKTIMDEYDKRRKTYEHNLSQTNKGIKLLMTASASILDKYPEKFI